MNRLCTLLLLLLGCADPSAGPAHGGAPQEIACTEPDCLPAPLPSEAPASVLPVSLAGADCESALPLAAGGESALLISMTGVPPALGCAPGLATAGAYFVLDLSAARAPVP